MADDETGGDSQDDEMTKTTFRVSQRKLDKLDDLIWENKVAGNLDRGISRSDVLREQVDELIEELEGNSTSRKATAVTAD